MIKHPNKTRIGFVRSCQGFIGALLLVGFVCSAAWGQEAPQPTQTKQADVLHQLDQGKEKPEAKPTPEADQPGPRIQIDQPTHDFGEVWVTPSLNAVFEVRNVGSEVLKITQVKPACGCTLKGQYDKEIPPGGVGKIPLTLKTRGLKKFKKSVTITCDDPVNPTQKIYLAGEIKYYVSAEPMRVNFLRIGADEKVKQVVKITTHTEKAQLELQGQGKADKFQATLAPGAAANEYQLTVEGLPPFKPRSNTAKFMVKTGVPQQPMLEIPVSAYVPERLEIKPAQLIVPQAREQPTKRTVMVINNGATPVEVLSATASNPEITAEIMEQTKGKNYRIALTLPANYAPPPNGDKLLLKLMDGTEQEHAVPILPPKKRQPPAKKPERPAMTLQGQPAPKTALSLHGGSTYQLGTGEDIVVLNFYATWCGFSKRQAPDVEKVYQTFKDNPKVRVISVSEDATEGRRGRPPEEVVSSFQERGLTHSLVLDPASEVGKLYKTTSFPTLFLLKGEKVEAVHIGAKKGLDQTVIGQINDLLAGKALKHVTAPPDQPKPKQERPAMALLGQPAPKAALNLHGGSSYQLGTGEDIVVLNFYATWCGFSKRQAPDVEKVYQAFKDNPKVRVISVSEDAAEGRRGRPPEEVVSSFQERGLTHGLVLDPVAQVGKLYKATSFPTLFLLKGEKVEAVHIGAKKGLDQTVIGQINDLLAGKALKHVAAPPDQPKRPRERPAMALLGQPVPKAALNLHGGSTYQLGDGDDIVVLNFYATWCGFSKRQAPDVEKVYQNFKDNPKVRVISVSEDAAEGRRGRPPEEVVSSFQERGLTHGLVLDPVAQVGKLYKATSFPTLFLLKGEKVEAVHIGAKKDLDQTVIAEIDKLLGGKSLIPPGRQKDQAQTEGAKPPAEPKGAAAADET